MYGVWCLPKNCCGAEEEKENWLGMHASYCVGAWDKNNFFWIGIPLNFVTQKRVVAWDVDSDVKENMVTMQASVIQGFKDCVDRVWKRNIWAVKVKTKTGPNIREK